MSRGVFAFVFAMFFLAGPALASQAPPMVQAPIQVTSLLLVKPSLEQGFGQATFQLRASLMQEEEWPEEDAPAVAASSGKQRTMRSGAALGAGIGLAYAGALILGLVD